MNTIKILVAEDEALIAALFKRSLQLAGYAVCGPVATGEAAIRAVAAEQPDVVLIDVRLAGVMDGIQAAQEIVARYGAVIIFVTGYSDRQLRARADAVPHAAYLVKPIAVEEIERVLAALRDRPRRGGMDAEYGSLQGAEGEQG